MKHFKYFLVALLSFICVAPSNAQSYQMKNLQNKTWRGISGYVAYDSVDWILAFTKDTFTSTCSKKEDKKNSVSYAARFYLSDSIPDTFDESAVGKTKSGRYLVYQYTDETKCDYFKILELTKGRLVIQAPNGCTVTFEME